MRFTLFLATILIAYTQARECVPDDFGPLVPSSKECTRVSGVDMQAFGKFQPSTVAQMCKFPECRQFFNMFATLLCTMNGEYLVMMSQICYSPAITGAQTTTLAPLTTKVATTLAPISTSASASSSSSATSAPTTDKQDDIPTNSTANATTSLRTSAPATTAVQTPSSSAAVGVLSALMVLILAMLA